MKRTLKQLILPVVLSSLVNLATAQQTGTHAVSDVPDEFREHYNQLETKLNDLDDYISLNWDGSKHPVVFATELLAASPNRGDMVLDPQVFEAVKFNLDAFQTLGVTGVSMDIKYPVIVPTFPRSDDYIEFFRNVTAEIRNRGFTLLIAIQTVFTDSIFGRQDIDFTGLTLEQYKNEKRQMAQTVIQEFHPDYLTVETEPATQAMNTGLDFSVENVTDIVNFVLDGLDRDGTLVGAGAGTWDDMTYIQSLSENTSIDYLDIHIYPIHGELIIDRIETIQQIAQTNNKKIVLGESWLYKTSQAEMADPEVGHLDIFPRDVFDFWTPLDQTFIELMVKLSHYIQIDFTSLFWMRYFWAYIPYNDTTRVLAATQRYAAVDQVVGVNMWMGNMTPTGQTYQQLLQENTPVESSPSGTPACFSLGQNVPNPFNPRTVIPYDLLAAGTVRISVYNALGQEVKTLVEGEKLAGHHQAIWDGTDASGRQMGSGVYICILQTGQQTDSRKMLLLR